MEAFIQKIRETRNTKSAVCEELANMCKPVLDMSYAGWVKERIKDDDIFLIISLRLFSPRTLAGERLASGNIRDKLSKHMGINPWSVSRRVRQVLFYYDKIKSFRARANADYKNVIEELGESGVLPNWEQFL